MQPLSLPRKLEAGFWVICYFLGHAYYLVVPITQYYLEVMIIGRVLFYCMINLRIYDEYTMKLLLLYIIKDIQIAQLLSAPQRTLGPGKFANLCTL